jgi:hypothetical protein
MATINYSIISPNNNTNNSSNTLLNGYQQDTKYTETTPSKSTYVHTARPSARRTLTSFDALIPQEPLNATHFSVSPSTTSTMQATQPSPSANSSHRASSTGSAIQPTPKYFPAPTRSSERIQQQVKKTSSADVSPHPSSSIKKGTTAIENGLSKILEPRLGKETHPTTVGTFP